MNSTQLNGLRMTASDYGVGAAYDASRLTITKTSSLPPLRTSKPSPRRLPALGSLPVPSRMINVRLDVAIDWSDGDMLYVSCTSPEVTDWEEIPETDRRRISVHAELSAKHSASCEDFGYPVPHGAKLILLGW